jgi:hypothetical protein
VVGLTRMIIAMRLRLRSLTVTFRAAHLRSARAPNPVSAVRTAQCATHCHAGWCAPPPIRYLNRRSERSEDRPQDGEQRPLVPDGARPPDSLPEPAVRAKRGPSAGRRATPARAGVSTFASASSSLGRSSTDRSTGDVSPVGRPLARSQRLGCWWPERTRRRRRCRRRILLVVRPRRRTGGRRARACRCWLPCAIVLSIRCG